MKRHEGATMRINVTLVVVIAALVAAFAVLIVAAKIAGAA
jgi:hypothetical protein